MTVFVCGAVGAVARTADAADIIQLNPRRIDAIAALLPERPTGFGRPAIDRAAWDDLRDRKAFGNVIGHAEELLKQEFPKWDDNLYLDFSRTGKRAAGEAMQNRRSAWLSPLALAECLEGKGRFLPKLNMILTEYARERTWTLPAVDVNLACFNGTAYTVELRSATFGHELAQTLYLLGDKLQPDVRRQVLAALETRIFAPMRRSFRTGAGDRWLVANSNWNAVCLAGVTGAALSVLSNRLDRALFVSAAEYYSQYYLMGYADDGYCNEGLSYWNYGFSNFITLREELLQATGQRIDLFSSPKMRAIALFGLRVQMAHGVAPAFGDCPFGTRPDESLIRYCDRSLGLGLPEYEQAGPVRAGVVFGCLDAFPGIGHKVDTGGKAAETVGVRSWFDKAAVLICRPAPNSPCRLSAAFKGGGNGVGNDSGHSHNDVGSFVIALGKEQLVGDPGGPRTYERGNFGPNRFKYKSLNSFGHPAPVVAGQLQRFAAEVRPTVLQTRFTDTQDELSLDIRSSYRVLELRKLVRTFRYDRQGQGAVTVEDSFAFTRPAMFEIAIPTHASWKRSGPNTIELGGGDERLVAEIATPGGFDVTSEVIEENAPPFTRIGIRLKGPLLSGVVRVTYRPGSVEMPPAAEK